MNILLDANIFLNVIFEEKEFLEKSRKLLKHVEARKFNAYISPLTLAEVIWIVRRENGLKVAREAQSYLRDLIELKIIKSISLNEEIVYNILNLVEKYNLDFIDSLVVSAAIFSNTILVTRDNKLKKVSEIKVKTPDELFIVYKKQKLN